MGTRTSSTRVLAVLAGVAIAPLYGCGADVDSGPDLSVGRAICEQLIEDRADGAFLSSYSFEPAEEVYVLPDLGQVSVRSTRPDGLVAVCGLIVGVSQQSTGGVSQQSTQVFATDGVLKPVLVDQFNSDDSLPPPRSDAPTSGAFND